MVVNCAHSSDLSLSMRSSSSKMMSTSLLPTVPIAMEVELPTGIRCWLKQYIHPKVTLKVEAEMLPTTMTARRNLVNLTLNAKNQVFMNLRLTPNPIAWRHPKRTMKYCDGFSLTKFMLLVLSNSGLLAAVRIIIKRASLNLGRLCRWFRWVQDRYKACIYHSTKLTIAWTVYGLRTDKPLR